MNITYDPKKEKANLSKHGLSFEEIEDFDFAGAVTLHDNRKEYGEVRLISIGMYQGQLHTVCYTYRDGDIRAISFRRSSMKERRDYEKAEKDKTTH